MQKRRNISGINVPYQFEGEQTPMPTAIEDCPDERQIEWIESMNHATAKQMLKILLGVIRKIGDVGGLIATNNNINFEKESLLNKIPEEKEVKEDE